MVKYLPLSENYKKTESSELGRLLERVNDSSGLLTGQIEFFF